MTIPRLPSARVARVLQVVPLLAVALLWGAAASLRVVKAGWVDSADWGVILALHPACEADPLSWAKLPHQFWAPFLYS